jgi:hypothetical protein
MADKYFKNVPIFGCDANKLTYAKEIAGRLKLSNACYCFIQNFLSMLSKNFMIKIHKTIILPVILSSV